MKTVKLSPPQIELLQALRLGEKVHYMNGLSPKCFYSSDVNKTLRWPTVFRLEELGLIKRSENYLQLTEAGGEFEITKSCKQ